MPADRNENGIEHRGVKTGPNVKRLLTQLSRHASDRLIKEVAVRDALAPRCEPVYVHDTASVSLTDLSHLATMITTRVRDRETSALDLALALHPTPARATRASPIQERPMRGATRLTAVPLWMVEARAVAGAAMARKYVASAGAGQPKRHCWRGSWWSPRWFERDDVGAEATRPFDFGLSDCVRRPTLRATVGFPH